MNVDKMFKILSLGLVSGLSLFAKTSMEEFLPAETTVFIKCNNVPEMVEKLRSSPWADLIDKPDNLADIQRAVEGENKDSAPWEAKEIWAKLDEAVKDIEGEVGFAIIVTEGALDKSEDPLFSFFIEFEGDNESAKKLLAQYQVSGFASSTEQEYDQGIMILQGDRGNALTTYDGYLLLSNHVSTLETLLDNALDGKDNVTDSFTYKKIEEEYLEGDLLMILNIEKIMDFMSGIMRISLEEKDNAQINADDFVNTLQLSEIKGISAHVNLGEEETWLGLDFYVSGFSGIMRLFNQYKPASPPTLSFVPNDVYELSWSSVNFSNLITDLESMLQDVYPLGYQMYTNQVRGMSQVIGIDFREILIRNLQSDLVYYNRLVEEDALGSQIVYSLSLENPEEVEAAILSLANMMLQGGTLFEEEEFLGYTIKNINPAMTGGISLASFVLVDNAIWISVGNPSLLKESLSNLVAQRDSFWERDPVEKSSTYFSGEPVAKSYFGDFGKIFNFILAGVAASKDQFDTGTQANDEGSNEKVKPNFQQAIMNAAKDYSIELPLFSTSEAYKTEDGLRSKTVVLLKE